MADGAAAATSALFADSSSDNDEGSSSSSESSSSSSSVTSDGSSAESDMEVLDTDKKEEATSNDMNGASTNGVHAAGAAAAAAAEAQTAPGSASKPFKLKVTMKGQSIDSMPQKKKAAEAAAAAASKAGAAAKTSAAGAAAAKKKKTKTKTKGKSKNNMTYGDMIVESIVAIADKKGSATQAVKSYIQKHFKVVSKGERFNREVSAAMKKEVASGRVKKEGVRHKVNPRIAAKIRAEKRKEDAEKAAAAFQKRIAEGSATLEEITAFKRQQEEEKKAKLERAKKARELNHKSNAMKARKRAEKLATEAGKDEAAVKAAGDTAFTEAMERLRRKAAEAMAAQSRSAEEKAARRRELRRLNDEKKRKKKGTGVADSKVVKAAPKVATRPRLPDLPVPVAVPFSEVADDLLSVAEFCTEYSSVLKLEPFTVDMLYKALTCDRVTTLLREVHLLFLGLCLEPEMKQAPEVVRWDWFKVLNSLTWQELLRRYLVRRVTALGEDYEGHSLLEQVIVHLAERNYVGLSLQAKAGALRVLVDDVNHHPEIIEAADAIVAQRDQVNKEWWAEEFKDRVVVRALKVAKKHLDKEERPPQHVMDDIEGANKDSSSDESQDGEDEDSSDDTESEDDSPKGSKGNSKGANSKAQGGKPKNGGGAKTGAAKQAVVKQDEPVVKVSGEELIELRAMVDKKRGEMRLKKEARNARLEAEFVRLRLRAEPWGRDAKGNMYVTFKCDPSRLYVHGASVRGEKQPVATALVAESSSVPQSKGWRALVTVEDVERLIANLDMASKREGALKKMMQLYKGDITGSLKHDPKALLAMAKAKAEEEAKRQAEEEAKARKAKEAEDEAKARALQEEELLMNDRGRPRRRTARLAQENIRNLADPNFVAIDDTQVSESKRTKKDKKETPPPEIPRRKKTWVDSDPDAFERYQNLRNYVQGLELDLENPTKEQLRSALDDPDVKLFKDAERLSVTTKVLEKDLCELARFLESCGAPFEGLQGGREGFESMATKALIQEDAPKPTLEAVRSPPPVKRPVTAFPELKVVPMAVDSSAPAKPAAAVPMDTTQSDAPLAAPAPAPAGGAPTPTTDATTAQVPPPKTPTKAEANGAPSPAVQPVQKQDRRQVESVLLPAPTRASLAKLCVHLERAAVEAIIASKMRNAVQEQERKERIRLKAAERREAEKARKEALASRAKRNAERREAASKKRQAELAARSGKRKKKTKAGKKKKKQGSKSSSRIRKRRKTGHSGTTLSGRSHRVNYNESALAESSDEDEYSSGASSDEEEEDVLATSGEDDADVAMANSDDDDDADDDEEGVNKPGAPPVEINEDMDVPDEEMNRIGLLQSYESRYPPGTKVQFHVPAVPTGAAVGQAALTPGGAAYRVVGGKVVAFRPASFLTPEKVHDSWLVQLENGDELWADSSRVYVGTQVHQRLEADARRARGRRKEDEEDEDTQNGSQVALSTEVVVVAGGNAPSDEEGKMVRFLWGTKSERAVWHESIEVAKTCSAWSAVVYQLANRIYVNNSLTLSKRR